MGNSRTSRQLLQRHAQTLERRQLYLHGRLEGSRADELSRDRAEYAALTTAIHLIHREIEGEQPFDPRELTPVKGPLKGPSR